MIGPLLASSNDRSNAVKISSNWARTVDLPSAVEEEIQAPGRQSPIVRCDLVTGPEQPQIPTDAKVLAVSAVHPCIPDAWMPGGDLAE
ncbi:hypothetical protein [Streptomyces sp. MK5]|uniref:hypothetical protein n=1 Tax=Streptomyces sp. MK5 TaxID=3064253 RepID=UPI0035579957